MSIALSALAISAASLQAATFIDFKNGGVIPGESPVSGIVHYEAWSNLNATATPNTPPAGPGTEEERKPYAPYGAHNVPGGWYYKTYNGTTWVDGAKATIASNLGSGSSTLWKSGGYGYIASALHQGKQTNDVEEGGTFELTISPIDGIQTLIFQIKATNRTGIDAGKYVFWDEPTLTFGGTTPQTGLEANIGLRYDRDVDFINNPTKPERNQDMDYYVFQWDLSGYEITGDIVINWTGLTNSGIYGMQLDQIQAVPEPSTWALITVAGIAGLAKLRRRQKAA